MKLNLHKNNAEANAELAGTDQAQIQVNLCAHIFSGSATMIGVCLTVIGIIRVAVNISGVETFADDMTFFAAVSFMCSCLLAYWGLHSHRISRLRRIERIADCFFIFGLLCMLAACSLITYEMLPTVKSASNFLIQPRSR